MRAVTVPVSAQSAVAGFIFPGDRIDLMLTQSVPGGGDGPPLKVSETIVRNLRVLATDQRTDNTVGEDGKTEVRTFSTVTVEATPKIAEGIAVAQTVGALSLSLRPLADTPGELEEAIASGSAKTSDDPHLEKAMLVRLASQPQVGDSTFSSGADISRFQRRSVPAGRPVATPWAAWGRAGRRRRPRRRQQLSGGRVDGRPVVRIARGNAVTAVPVGGK